MMSLTLFVVVVVVNSPTVRDYAHCKYAATANLNHCKKGATLRPAGRTVYTLNKISPDCLVIFPKIVIYPYIDYFKQMHPGEYLSIICFVHRNNKIIDSAQYVFRKVHCTQGDIYFRPNQVFYTKDFLFHYGVIHS